MQIVQLDWQRGGSRHQYQSLNGRVPRGIGRGAVTRHASQVDFSGNGDQQSSLRNRLRSLWPFNQREADARAAAEKAAVEAAAAEASRGGSPPAASSSSSGFSPFLQPNSPALQPTMAPPTTSAQNLPEAVWPALTHGDQRWMPDEKCPVCFHCGASFGAFRRRHHCRLCGQIFCHSCSSHFVAGKLIGRKEQQSRLCEVCTLYCDGLTIHGDRARLRTLPPSPGAPRHAEPGRAEAGGGGVGSIPETPSPMEAPATFRPRSSATTLNGSSAPQLGSPYASEAPEPIVDAARPRRRGPPLEAELQAQPGEEPWPAAQQGEESLPSDLSEQDDDDDFAYDDEDSHSELGQLLQQGVAEQPWAAETRSFRSDSVASDTNEEDGLTATWYWGDPRLPLRQRAEVGLPAAATQHLEELWLEEADEPSKVGEPGTAAAHSSAWRKMSEVAFRHFVRSVRECCLKMGGGLEDTTHVLAICELAQQVVDHLTPSIGDAMDILSYVKVKRIPGGQITDSQWVDGVVFSRDIAHRKMRSTIAGCHLALLREPLSFDHDHRLTRLDDLRRQEADFIDLKVDKIADDLQPMPELLLCQGGVSQIAQEKLRNRNISLVLGVPSHILDAVARCTGAKVLQSVDSIVRCTAGGKNAVVGQCRNFTVKHTGETGEAGSKPLVVIEGSCVERFSTVCLRGGEGLAPNEALALLSRAKRVLRWAIRLARHLQLESELLFEMWCEPWPRQQPTFTPIREGAQEVEYLDLTCYRVSKREERSCSKPAILQLPVYALPQMPPPSGSPPTTWAGGLDGGPIEGIRDCTLHEWLVRCFTPERSATSAFGGNAAAALLSDECRLPAAAEGAAAEAGSDGSSRDSELLVAGVAGDSSLSGSVGRCASASAGGAAAARFLELPTPSSTAEILYFQHKRSRIVVELRDSHEALRARATSSIERGVEAYAARTRWALLGRDDDEGGPDADCGGAGNTGPAASNVAAAGVGRSSAWVAGVNASGAAAGGIALGASGAAVGAWGSAGGGGAGACSEVEVWRWCKICGRQVTPPRNALSASARWHSVTKFLELLLHNDTSECSPLAVAGSNEEPCPHAAFRNHVLFFSSPQRPLIVGLCWEQVNFWQLQPPHLPFWDPETRALTAGVSSHCPGLARLLAQLHDLTDSIDSLIRCVLTALSTADEKEPLPIALGNVGSVDDALYYPLAPENGHGSATAAGVGAAESLARLQPMWLEEWVWGNRAAWHRAIRQLTRLHADLLQRLAAAEERLYGREAPDGGSAVDPVLASFVHRDLLDALREDHKDHNTRMPGESSLRGAHSELLALRKPRQQPSDERKGLSIPLPYALSSIASSAKETLKRLWPSEVESSEAVSSAVSPAAIPVRTRASSVHGRSPQRRRSSEDTYGCVNRQLPRCNSSENLLKSGGHVTWRRMTSMDCTSMRVKEARELHALPAQVHRVLHALSEAAEESNCRLAGLDRGVQGLCLPVQEDDVGSMIAHALLSRQCQEQMAVQWAQVTGGRTCCPLACSCGDEWSCFASFPASLSGACPRGSPNSAAASSSSTSAPAPVAPCDSLPTSPNIADFPWKQLPGHVFGSGDDGPLARRPWEDHWERLGVRSVLTAMPQEQPIRVEFADKEAKYSVAIHHAPQYHILRHWLCGDDLNFVRSLYRCNRITPSGGKSRAAFFVSHDRRFLLKAVNTAEFKMLTTQTQAQAIFAYDDQVLFDKLPSVLAQVVGLFTVSVRLHKKTRESRPRYFIVQRNLRFSLQRRPHFVFDLKGVGKNRRVPSVMPGVHGQAQAQAQADDSDEAEQGTASAECKPERRASKAVLWDQNFREWTEGKPLCLLSRDQKYLESAVYNDTSLLSRQSLVDYSLLLAAVQPDAAGLQAGQPSTLALGIIDWLRPYTWDKQMETMVKSMATADKPTVIEPRLYARRFLDAMGTFFVAETSSSN